jgi:hypothetical protein
MLIDFQNSPQPVFGTQSHWSILHQVMADHLIFSPLQAEVIRTVNAAFMRNAASQFISSRIAGSEVLNAVGASWHGLFHRRFPNLTNGAASGLFGMALWNHLAGRNEAWRFIRVADPHGYGFPSTDYWR